MHVKSLIIISEYLHHRYSRVDFRWQGYVYLVFVSVNPNSHALFNISWRHLIPKVHNELGKLLHVDYVLWVIWIGVDDFCASCYLKIIRELWKLENATSKMMCLSNGELLIQLQQHFSRESTRHEKTFTLVEPFAAEIDTSSDYSFPCYSPTWLGSRVLWSVHLYPQVV